jgi:hypothetical protein
MQIVIPGRRGVDVLHSLELMRAVYGNLCACHSVWNCPVCASSISEQRALLLDAGIRASKVTPALITLTMRHNADQPLKANLTALKAAYKILMQSKWGDNFRGRFWWLSSISAVEVTYGENGWHPHLHILGLFQYKLPAEYWANLEIELSERWINQLRGQGADADKTHGVDVKQTFGEVAEYLSKFGRAPTVKNWTPAREMTKAVVKQGRLGGRTPWALLVDYAQGDQQSGQLFIEYANAFKGTKQLNISSTAKKLLGLDKIINDDKALAKQALSVFDHVLMTLNRDQWNRVLLSDQRQPLLEQAASGDINALNDWLSSVGIL